MHRRTALYLSLNLLGERELDNGLLICTVSCCRMVTNNDHRIAQPDSLPFIARERHEMGNRCSLRNRPRVWQQQVVQRSGRTALPWSSVGCLLWRGDRDCPAICDSMD